MQARADTARSKSEGDVYLCCCSCIACTSGFARKVGLNLGGNLMRLRLSLCAGVMSAILLLEACVSQRLGQFRNFSQVGVAYVKASDTFFDEAGSAAIRGDN